MIVTGTEVAVGTVKQGTDVVISTVITSPFSNESTENTSALLPTLFPFNFH